MKNWERFGIAIMSLWGLYAVHEGVAGFIQIHKWPGMGISDWATWVGSIGTILTWIWTIRLATAGKREARAQALDRAFVAVASLEGQLADVERSLSNAVNHFLDYYAAQHGFQYGIQADLIEKAGSWTDEQILPLIVLPNNVCARLASVRAVISSSIGTLRELQVTQGYSWVQEQKAEIDGKLTAALIRCQGTVGYCLHECQRFASERGF